MQKIGDIMDPYHLHLSKGKDHQNIENKGGVTLWPK